MRRRFLNCLAVSITLSGISIALGMLAKPVSAQSLYFDINGTTAGYGIVSGSTYSWDDNNWATATGGATATGAWVQGDFARFQGGVSGNSYTVTVGNDEQNIGLFQTVNGVSLTINQAGAAGRLNVVGGIQGFINGGANANLTINAPITGTGGINPQSGGNMYINGVNTFTGGTSLTSSSTLVHFNNGSAFGTGTITNNLTTATNFAPLLASGGATVTLANNFVQATTSGAGFNFAADANTPVVSTGTWSLGALNLNLRNTGSSTSPLLH